MSLRLNLKDNYMRKYFLFGLAALGLIALAPTESKADDGFSVYVNPGYQQFRPYYYDSRTATAIIVTRTNIGGTGSHHRHHYDRTDYDRDYDRD